MNPMDLINMLRGGGNPQTIVNQLVGNNPQMKQVLGNLQGKSPQELRNYAENLAKERGTSLEALENQLGIKLPK